MVFLAADWQVFGNKHAWAKELNEVTGISESTLRLEKDIPHSSVAERLSWAANRRTTRPEDIAYCLLGLFGITLPLSYGEGGESAFYRLQEEIIKTTVDASIFVWGKSHKVKMSDRVQNIVASLERQHGGHREPHAISAGDIIHRPYLLASSPDAFSQLMDIAVRVVNSCHHCIPRRALAELICVIAAADRYKGQSQVKIHSYSWRCSSRCTYHFHCQFKLCGSLSYPWW